MIDPLSHQQTHTLHCGWSCELRVKHCFITDQGVSWVCSCWIRGGVKTIPACNAAWSGLLHIIDFRHASFILRLVFAVCTTGNSKQCLETLSFRWMMLCVVGFVTRWMLFSRYYHLLFKCIIDVYLMKPR